jgi:hypothetical protein
MTYQTGEFGRGLDVRIYWSSKIILPYTTPKRSPQKIRGLAFPSNGVHMCKAFIAACSHVIASRDLLVPPDRR